MDGHKADGTFEKGSGGRPKGSRNKLSEAFLRVLADDFEEHGMEAIEELRKTNPGMYANVIARLMPKLMELTGADGDALLPTDITLNVVRP